MEICNITPVKDLDSWVILLVDKNLTIGYIGYKLAIKFGKISHDEPKTF
jgi:hypothetical protein